jgi:hypothetical protein
MWVTINHGAPDEGDDRAVALRTETRKKGGAAISMRILATLAKQLGWREGIRLRLQMESKAGFTGRVRLAAHVEGEIPIIKYPSVKNRLALTMRLPCKYTLNATVYAPWRVENGALVFTLPYFTVGQGAKTAKTQQPAAKPAGKYKISPEARERLMKNLERAREVKRVMRELSARGLVQAEEQAEPVIKG